MSPKTGRPIKGTSKRDKSLQLRMSQEELNLLDECAKRLEESRTDVVNRGIQLVKKDWTKSKGSGDPIKDTPEPYSPHPEVW